MTDDKSSKDKNLPDPTGTGVSAESYKALWLMYKKTEEKLKKENEVLLDFNMQVNDLMAVYSNGKDGDDIIDTLRRILIEYDDMKTELAINQDSFSGGRIAVKDVGETNLGKDEGSKAEQDEKPNVKL